ncbi:hypothetical protein RHSIM_Rhsim03G0082700 [Rhododendron simsii]|uniref:Uncharacterized protein n=1 Tax=Rhododendron simsii TaxID=118357 RepID=A0A834HAN7_RHOSS|nr:hypothetical protein RHSIM_Rhsim03G0082700 [Rhododendron simsii]
MRAAQQQHRFKLPVRLEECRSNCDSSSSTLLSERSHVDVSETFYGLQVIKFPLEDVHWRSTQQCPSMGQRGFSDCNNCPKIFPVSKTLHGDDINDSRSVPENDMTTESEDEVYGRRYSVDSSPKDDRVPANNAVAQRYYSSAQRQQPIYASGSVHLDDVTSSRETIGRGNGNVAERMMRGANSMQEEVTMELGPVRDCMSQRAMHQVFLRGFWANILFRNKGKELRLYCWSMQVMLDTVGAELQVVNNTEKTLQLQEDGRVILTPDHGQEASSEILPINCS